MPRELSATVRFVPLLVTLVVGSAVPASAQRSWDVAGFTGGWWGLPEDAATPERYDDGWFGAWVAAISAGRYWTPFIKTEIDAAFTSEGDRYVTRQVVLPGERNPIFVATDSHHQQGSVAALVTLQAGRNWWVHPFLQGGVSLDWDRMRVTTLPIVVGGRPVVPEPDEADVGTRQVTRGVFGGGAKFYMSETSFFRADVRTSFGGGATHVQFRTGFGIDF
jgi:hypothetical protein